MVCVFVEGLQTISLFDLSVFLAHKAALIQAQSQRTPQYVIMQTVNSKVKLSRRNLGI